MLDLQNQPGYTVGTDKKFSQARETKQKLCFLSLKFSVAVHQHSWITMVRKKTNIKTETNVKYSCNNLSLQAGFYPQFQRH